MTEPKSHLSHQSTVLDKSATLKGGVVLPSFTLPLCPFPAFSSIEAR